MHEILTFAFLLALWSTLFVSGFVFLAVAPLDPHNPVQMPSLWFQGVRSLVAATAVTIAPVLNGDAGLISACFGVGMILSAGLIDPFKSKRAAEPS